MSAAGKKRSQTKITNKDHKQRTQADLNVFVFASLFEIQRFLPRMVGPRENTVFLFTKARCCPHSAEISSYLKDVLY